MKRNVNKWNRMFLAYGHMVWILDRIVSALKILATTGKENTAKRLLLESSVGAAGGLSLWQTFPCFMPHLYNQELRIFWLYITKSNPHTENHRQQTSSTPPTKPFLREHTQPGPKELSVPINTALRGALLWVPGRHKVHLQYPVVELFSSFLGHKKLPGSLNSFHKNKTSINVIYNSDSIQSTNGWQIPSFSYSDDSVSLSFWWACSRIPAWKKVVECSTPVLFPSGSCTPQSLPQQVGKHKSAVARLGLGFWWVQVFPRCIAESI